MWRSEPQAVKDEWKRKSEDVKAQHAKSHPDYQYQPRKHSEKKRRMTKRKAEALASAASQSSAIANETTAGFLEMPSFDFSTNGQAASFTFDPAQENQIELFNSMLENHNTLMSAPALPNLNAPAAATSFATAVHQNEYNFDMANDDLGLAEAEIFNFEESLEAQLAKELETLEQEQQWGREVPQGYNDAEAQRFTDFLVQMPSHMWGMEFVDYP